MKLYFVLVLLLLCSITPTLADNDDDDDDGDLPSGRKVMLFNLDSTQVTTGLASDYSAFVEMGYTPAKIAAFLQEAANYFYERIGFDVRGVQPVLTDFGGGNVGLVVFGNGGFLALSYFRSTFYRLEASSGVDYLNIPRGFTPFVKDIPHWILFINPGFVYNGTYTAEGNDGRSGPGDNWSYGFTRIQIRGGSRPEILNIKYWSYAPSVVDQPGLPLLTRTGVARIAERVSLFHPRLGEGVGAIDIGFNDRGYWRIRNSMVFPSNYLLP